MKKTTISAVIAVKNEENIIEKCLSNLNWVDEIIIIDNGCTDNTINICKKYADKIITYNKPALIPYLQNLGIQKTTKNWIIIIDADVIVTKEARGEILKKINDKNYDAYYLRHIIYFLGKPLSSPYFGEHNILKLFRRNKGYFKGERPHEELTFSGKNKGYINNALIHYAHPSIYDFVRKMNKYTSEEAQNHTCSYDLFQIFIVPFFSIFYYFFIRKGFLDRTRGFIYCCLLGIYIFFERVKILEKKFK